MQRTAGALVVLAALIALTGCGAATPTAQSLAVSGSVLILEPAHMSRTGTPCTGKGALSPIKEGASVSIDKQLAATLSRGVVTEEGNCRFLFSANVSQTQQLQRHTFAIAGLPPVTGVINDRVRATWQAAETDGWVTIGWD